MNEEFNAVAYLDCADVFLQEEPRWDDEPAKPADDDIIDPAFLWFSPNTMPTFAIQPIAWRAFDGYGCDYAPTIEAAYQTAKIWRQLHDDGDMLIFRINPGATPMPWVRVYANESMDSMHAAAWQIRNWHCWRRQRFDIEYNLKEQTNRVHANCHRVQVNRRS